eukprot:3344373-Prymnesium_polylepis.1
MRGPGPPPRPPRRRCGSRPPLDPRPPLPFAQKRTVGRLPGLRSAYRTGAHCGAASPLPAPVAP